MSDLAIAVRYARAIFELGTETGQLATLIDDLRKLTEVYQQSPELSKVLRNPLVPEGERVATITEIAQRLGLSPLGRNTAALLTSKKRMFALPSITAELDRMADEKAGVSRATVISAEPLSDAYAQRLTDELQAMTGKKIVLSRKHDPDLLAGLIVRIGDQVIDGSAKTRVSELVSQLLSA